MKIAAFVTDFPLHLLCWLCDIIDGLAVRGVQVDLFLYKAGQPPQFRPGVRVIPLPEDGQPGSELVAKAAIESLRKIASQVPYDACIGFESRALLLAKIASDTAKCPLIHHNFELYDPEHPGVWQKEFAEIKRIEGRLIREVDLFLIQDAAREREYFRILGTDNRPLNTMHFPVSLPRLADRPKPRYWHETYNLAPSTRVVFYIGQLTAARFVDRMIVAAQSFRPDQQLVVHGPFYNNMAALKQLTDLDEKRRVIFSTQLLAWDQIVRISASADIGLVMYRRQMINEFTTGRSSDKLARYLQSGIPVICPDFPSFREGVDAYHFGLCCSDFAQMPNLVNRICDDYATYQNGARRAFEEIYNLDRHLDALVPVLQRIGSDKKRIPSIHSTPSRQGIAGQSPIAVNTPSPAGESAIPTPASPPVTQTLGGDGTLFQYTNHVYLELSNLCNYAHLHKACPVAQLAQNKDILPSRIVEDVLDTLHRYKFRGRIGFHTYNEPLMDPRLTQFTRRARQACPDSEIYICTNGYYLDQTMAEELVQTGVNHIHVSAYSDSEQRRLEAIRVPVQYHVDRMTLDKRMDAYDKPETDDNRPCYSPLYQIIVTAAGRISLCCMDWKRQHCFGDLHKQTFEQAMNDPAMWSLYEQLSKGDRRLSLCKRCQFVRGKAEPEITMNQSSPSAQSFNRSGGPVPQASALPVAPTTSFPSPSSIAYGPRVVTPSTEPDPNKMLARAREHYENGRFDEAFDLYEQLSVAYPQSAVEILAEAYDLYRTIPDPDRYVLYQSRFFNFGIRPGDKVIDIGSGNVPFRLATHLADLTTRDNQLGRAGAPFKHLDGKPVIQCDIAKMPFADKEFDFAYCSHVLEHVDDPAAACKELMRIAKRGYIEAPSSAKDLWMDTIAVSNHRWAVESVGGKLVFTEYSPAQKLGLRNNILRDMACSPQSSREKAFSALVYLKANQLNTMLLWDGGFAYEVRPRDLGAGVAHAVLPGSCAPEPSQQKEPRFSFVMIVLNGMPLIEYSLRSIYDFAHEIIVVEGAVKNCLAAANPDGSSRDGTVEFLRSFPDPKRKIRLIQGLWPEKCQMQNKALEYVTGDYVWLIDSDEVYKPQDLETLRDLLDKDPTITQVNFIPDNFWKGLDYIFVSPMFFQSEHHYRRLFKYVPGAVFTTHRPPTLVWPGSDRTTEQMRLLDGFQTRKMGILPYHYSYVFEHQVAQKNTYYARQWGDRVNGVDRQEWFERCYRAWTPQNRQQIETQYPVWINDRNSRTEPFSGTHPAIMEEFRLRLQHATSPASRGGALCPPVEASRDSSTAGPAPGSKGKVACDYVSSGATVNTESQFAVGIGDLFARIRPRKIIETGTYLGTGTTTIIARALEELGISDAVFCTIEVNPKHWSQAKDYFRDARLNVHAVLGLSIPRSMLPSPAQIEKQTVADLGGEDIFVDHRPGERVGAYHRETDFPDVPDNRLYECLKAFGFCPDFVLLDSAGHIGAIEFDYLLEHLQGPCHIALDDIYHIKHHRNFQRMQSDPRFEILTASKEKFGFCIARFTPQPAGRRDSIRRILWLRTDSIGDGILSASMLPHIHRRFGDARITVVCQQHIAELYESCPHVEDVITVPSEHRWESDAQYQEFLGKVRGHNPDLLLNSTWATHGLADLPGLEFIPHRIALRQAAKASYTQIIPTDPAPMPELHRHRDFLRGLGIEVASLQPVVWLTDEDKQFAEQVFRQHGLDPERTVALFAGSRTPHRQYEQYGQAIRTICAENSLSIIALGCKSDLGINQRNLLDSGAGGLNLSGGCTLRQTAALLHRCRLAIGAETGLAHLACAIGTPNVVLLGGGHFGRFMPYSPLTTIAALPLDCYGCDWTCRHKRIHCVRDLNPGVLAHAVREALSCDSNDIRVCVQGPSLWAQHPDRPQWQGCQSWLPSQPTRIITLNDSATPEAPMRVAPEVPAGT